MRFELEGGRFGQAIQCNGDGVGLGVGIRMGFA